MKRKKRRKEKGLGYLSSTVLSLYKTEFSLSPPPSHTVLCHTLHTPLAPQGFQLEVGGGNSI